MSVYRSKGQKAFRYDFIYAGHRYKGNTYQLTKGDAKLVESRIRLQLRQQRGGIAPPVEAPSFAAWSGTYYEHLEKLQKRTGRPKRIEKIDELLRVVLRFWGRRPEDPEASLQPRPGEEAPFHDLTLTDPIDDPSWILKFEDWMDRRGLAGGTRNHYLTTLSQLYALAVSPDYRKQTGITMNPFAGRPRAPKVHRTVALTPAQVSAWVAEMSYHARLAVSIAALAPKLRLQNVLQLRWDQYFDAELTTITVTDHKSAHVTGAPLVTPISGQLREILLDAKARTKGKYVVSYRGGPITRVRGAIEAAARAAGIPYGRALKNGVTFHTLRHTASTLLARLDVNPWIHRDALGHQDVTTTTGYTHLRSEEQRPALEQLSAALPIAALVMAPRRRAVRKDARGVAGGPSARRRQKANVSAVCADSPILPATGQESQNS